MQNLKLKYYYSFEIFFHCENQLLYRQLLKLLKLKVDINWPMDARKNI